MTLDITSLMQNLANLVTLAVAVVSISIAMKAEKRNQERFDEQIKSAEKLAAASVRPLVAIVSQSKESVKSINLVNRGIGPAVVKLCEFKKGNMCTNNMREVFDFIQDSSLWDSFRKLNGKFFLAPGQEIALVRLTKQKLIEKGIEPQDATRMLEEWKKQKRGVEVCIEYEDVLGNDQEKYCDTLI